VAAVAAAAVAVVADTMLAGLECMAAEIVRFDTVLQGRVGGYTGRARAC
jgi:hypothetical protein